MSRSCTPTAPDRLPARRRPVFQATRTLAAPLLAPFFHLERRGLEHLPRNSAFVLLPKHQRWVDIPVIAVATPRPLYYVAKAELFRYGPGRWFLSSLGGIPLNRKRPLESRRSLRAVLDYLSAGDGVVIFPEGTYFRGRMGPGQVGMIRLVATRLRLPFIPVGLRYERGLWRTCVRVRFGRPLFPDPGETPSSFLNRAMKKIAQLSEMDSII